MVIFTKKIPTPLYLTPQLTGVPLEFCNGGEARKTEWCPYKQVKKCDYMSILPQYRHWTERQTELVEQYRCLHVLQADAR